MARLSHALLDRHILPDSKNFTFEFLTSPNHQVIIATKNNQAWQISDDFTQLNQVNPDTKTDWVKMVSINNQPAPIALQEQLLKTFDSPLTLEKIILELHNGYFFGKIGSWLIDLASLLFILMVISGIRLHLKR